MGSLTSPFSGKMGPNVQLENAQRIPERSRIHAIRKVASRAPSRARPRTVRWRGRDRDLRTRAKASGVRIEAKLSSDGAALFERFRFVVEVEKKRGRVMEKGGQGLNAGFRGGGWHRGSERYPWRGRFATMAGDLGQDLPVAERLKGELGDP